MLQKAHDVHVIDCKAQTYTDTYAAEYFVLENTTLPGTPAASEQPLQPAWTFGQRVVDVESYVRAVDVSIVDREVVSVCAHVCTSVSVY